MQAFLCYADKGRAEHPKGTVRFRPSAFKAHLLLIKATFNESRTSAYYDVLPLALIVRNDVKLIPILIFSEQVANCIERLFFFDIMIGKVLENLIYDATKIVLSQIKNVYFNA